MTRRTGIFLIVPRTIMKVRERAGMLATNPVAGRFANDLLDEFAMPLVGQRIVLPKTEVVVAEVVATKLPTALVAVGFGRETAFNLLAQLVHVIEPAHTAVRPVTSRFFFLP